MRKNKPGIGSRKGIFFVFLFLCCSVFLLLYCSFFPPSLPPSLKRKKQQKRMTKSQSALVHSFIHRRPQHLALVLSLPPSLRQEWGFHDCIHIN